MNKMYKNLMLLCCMALISVSNGVFAQETCAEATALTVDGAAVTGDNTGAIDENAGSEPGCWGTDGADGDVWFSVEGTGGLLDIQTFEGTNDDSNIAVYDACDGTVVGCDDDGGDGAMSLVTFCAELGTTYFIEVEGWNGTEGTFNISAVTSAATGDLYCGDPTATNFNDSPTSCDIQDDTTCDFPATNETCDGAIPVTVDGDLVLGDNTGAIDENDPDNGGAGEGTCWGADGTEGDVWFSFEGTGGLVDVEVFCLGMTDSQMAIYDACDGTQVGCDDDGAVAPNCGFMSRVLGLCTELGTTYYIEVEGWNGNTGDFEVGVVTSTVAPTTYCGDPTADQYVEFPEACWVEDNSTCTFCAPINDVCSGAFPLPTDGSTFAGINVCAQPDDEPSCEFGNAFGVWYTFDSGANNAVALSLSAALSPVDSALVGPEVAVFSGDCGSLTQLFCASGAQNGTVVPGLELSTTYYVLVWTDAALDQGEFDISLLAGSAGCTDPTACNFDAGATLDIDCDFSCIGCLDEAAFNYDEDFTIACEDCCLFNDACADAKPVVVDGDLVFGSNDGATDENDVDNGGAGEGICFGADGTDGDAWFSFEGTGGLVDVETFCLGMADSQMAIYDACGGNQVACDDDGAVAPNCGFMSRVQGLCTELGVTYYIEVEGWNGATGTFNVGVTTSVIAPDTYCDDELAVNYDADPAPCTVPDALVCDYNGCTDEAACNFDGLSIEDGGALTDDGSCCIGNCAVITLTDAFGDGWNGAIYTLTNVDTDEVASTGGLTGTQNGGDFVIYEECIPDGCYNLTITAGFFPSEIGFTIETQEGLLFEATDVLNDGDFANTDLIYDLNISFGGAACPIEGCTDEAALNYNPQASLDCSGDEGGTDLSCCNYPEENDECEGAIAIAGGDTEDFNVQFASNSGNACNPTAGDLWYVYTAVCDNVLNISVLQEGFFSGTLAVYTGSCGDLTEIGCFGPAQANNVNISVTAGTTYYFQAGINPEDIFFGLNGSISLTEGLCEGCTYDAASNFDEIAVLDNGTCEFPSSCTCPGDFNNDGNVSVVDLGGFLAAFGQPCSN